MLAICAALQWEARPILRALGTVRREKSNQVRVWRSVNVQQPVLVFRTGMGWERAAASTRAVLSEFPVRALLNTGCAGGLAPGLSVAEVVVSTAAVAATDPATVYSTDGTWTNRLYAAAARAGLPASRGTIVTSRGVLSTTADKRSAANAFGALAVDMEGAAIAEVAASRGVPFASARAVLDPVSMDIPRPPGQDQWSALVSRPVSYASNLGEIFSVAWAAYRVHVALGRLFRALLDDDCFTGRGKV